MFFKKKKNIEKVCNNCRLFDSNNKLCKVVVLHEGQKINIPVDPSDSCFFEQDYFDPITNIKSDFNEIREIKVWVENEKGEKADHGTVKVEIPNEIETIISKDVDEEFSLD